MIDLIIPVYDGLSQTKRCIDSVLHVAHLNPSCNIIVVNDCSPNVDIHRYLQKLALDKKIHLIVNEVNLGFVATVNKAMRLSHDHDVLLLNSDTEVANNWLERILQHADIDKKIATITPFSNNAEICSFPIYCKSNDLLLGKTVADIDVIFSQLPIHHFDAPTGVGFCMYIRRSALNDVGYFDEQTFGRGYGEENDFCQRVALAGWRNVICANVFVFHEGGVSFSSEKQKRVENAMKIIDSKYPNYHADIQRHIQQDPERIYRTLAQLKLISKDRRIKVLAVAHGLGGGVVKHIAENSKYLVGDVIQFVLRPCDNNYFQLSYCDDGFDISLLFERSKIQQRLIPVLKALGVTLTHWHHTLGYSLGEVKALLSIPCRHRASVHDYYWIGGNPTLTNINGVFVADPSLRDEACLQAYPLPVGITLEEWREFYCNFFSTMDLILCPSEISADLMREYYSEFDYTVVPHSDWELHGPYSAVSNVEVLPEEKFRVLVVGALSREKGADVLERAASYRDNLERLEYHLLGYAYRPLCDEVICHGPYRDHDLQEKIQQINPHLVWFPAQWHETYCYVLSTVLRMGLPVLSTNLGALQERLANRPLSFIHSWQVSGKECNDTLLQIRDWLQQVGDEPQPWLQSNFYEFRYAVDYIRDVPSTSVDFQYDYDFMREAVYSNDKIDAAKNSRSENFLRLLWWLRQLPVLRVVAKLLPFSFQRRIKRALSVKPIHEVIDC